MNRDAQTEEAVKRLVTFFAPERVYLFGSTARGEDRPNSDLDFLIVAAR
jgi:predicted nucleotidyltransferase